MRILGQMPQQPQIPGGGRILGTVDDKAALLGSVTSTDSRLGITTGQFKLPGQDTAVQVAEGVAKSGIGTLSGLAKIGRKITTGIGSLFGVGESTPETTTEAGQALDTMSTPTNTAQTVGKVAGDVAQFFTPAGIEKTAMTKAGAAIDKIPEALQLGEKAGKIVTGGLKIGANAGITGLSTAAVTAAQTGDLNQAKNAGIVGTVAGGFGKLLEEFGGPLAKALNKADFKLTPAAEAKAARKADAAAQFITENRITGSNSSKLRKLNNLNDSIESTLQKSLGDTDAIGSRTDIKNRIDAKIESLATEDPAIYDAARRYAERASGLLDKTKTGDLITVKDMLNSKRSYGAAAFKQSKSLVKDPAVAEEGAYAVEQAFQESLEDSLSKANTKIKLPGSLQSFFGGKTEVTLPELNKVYSNAISAKNLTRLAVPRSDTGLVGRLFGLWAGETLGQTVAPGLGGKIVGGALGEVASSRLPGVLRNIGERTIANAGVAPSAAKVGLGMTPRVETNDENANND